jgi:hypothetical protein
MVFGEHVDHSPSEVRREIHSPMHIGPKDGQLAESVDKGAFDGYAGGHVQEDQPGVRILAGRAGNQDKAGEEGSRESSNFQSAHY